MIFKDDAYRIAKSLVSHAERTGIAGVQFIDGKLKTGYTSEASAGVVVDFRADEPRPTVWFEPRSELWNGYRIEMSKEDAVKAMAGFLLDFEQDGFIDVE